LQHNLQVKKALLQHWLHKGVERLGRRHNTQPNDNTPQNEVICYSEKRHPEPATGDFILSVDTLYLIFIAILRVAMRVYICWMSLCWLPFYWMSWRRTQSKS